MTTRKRKTAPLRKAEIVETALRLAAEVGPDRLTTEALAREVGISQAAIFRHFPKKNDIWEAVARRIGELVGNNWAAALHTDATAGETLQAFVIGHLTFLRETPAIPAILFSRELHAENETLRAFFADLVRRGHRYLSELIEREKTAGRFDRELDADDAAYLVLAFIQGLAMRWSLNSRDFDLVAEGRRLLTVLLNGFRRR